MKMALLETTSLVTTKMYGGVFKQEEGLAEIEEEVPHSGLRI
jgi:hypothetical protein